MEYLKSYYDFDEAILDGLERVAHDHKDKTFAQVADKYHLDHSVRLVTPPGAAKPIEVATLLPAGDYDHTEGIEIEHAAMGGPVDNNALYKMIVRHEADPTRPRMLVGNPSGPGQGYGKLTLAEARKVACSGDLAPTVGATLSHAKAAGAVSLHHVGYSLGAHKALTAIEQAPAYGLEVRQSALIEPVGYGGINLLKRFFATGAQAETFVNQSNSTAYYDARESLSMVRYGIGLLRLTNLAIGAALMRGDFKDRALQIFPEHAEKIWVAAGEESELAKSDELENICEITNARFARIQTMPHAGGEDVYLHAALMLQGTR